MCLRLAIHAILLLLASTDFTIVNLALGKGSLRWCYFGHVSEHGFGYEFVSDYSVLSILMYVLAFAVGIAGFSVALQHGHRVVGSLGVVLSVIGLVSFAIEGSHWMIEHNLSWLAFSPAVMFSLVLVACFFQRPANDAHTHPTTAWHFTQDTRLSRCAETRRTEPCTGARDPTFVNWNIART